MTTLHNPDGTINHKTWTEVEPSVIDNLLTDEDARSYWDSDYHAWQRTLINDNDESETRYTVSEGGIIIYLEDLTEQGLAEYLRDIIAEDRAAADSEDERIINSRNDALTRATLDLMASN